MERVCPLCNGLYNTFIQCQNCGSKMEDRGPLVDYYGPYSPYRDYDNLQMTPQPEEAGSDHCLHLLACPRCGEDHRVPVSMLFL